MLVKSLFEGPPPVIIWDVSNIAHQAANSRNKLTTSKGEPSNHIFVTFRKIISLVKKISPVHSQKVELWFAFDGCPQKRLELSEGNYKANRDHQKSFSMSDVKDMLKVFPGTCWYDSNVEADDIITSLCSLADKERKKVIVSNDKDFWQLLNVEKLSIWSSKEWVTPQMIKEKYGVERPNSVALVKALFGDKGDNIDPIVPRLTKKPLFDLINKEKLTKPSSLIKQLRKKYNRENAVFQKVMEHKKELKNNFQLVKLNPSLEINSTEVKSIKDCKVSHKTGEDNLPISERKKILKRILTRWECTSLIEQFDFLFGKCF